MHYAVCLFVDFRKAFDTLNHQRLLNKLDLYGIRGIPLELLKSYLTNRRQRVCIDGVSSDFVPTTMGVPQGSKLGPLLFNLYVNDLSTSLNNNSTFQYADDAGLASVGTNLNQLIESFNINLRTFFDWCQANKLVLNFEKTKAMIFTPKKLQNFLPNISINNINIEYVNEYKYLGLILDNKLSFKKHVNNLKARLNSLVGASYSLKNILSLNAARSFYHGMAASLINYLIVIWGGIGKSSINSLQVAQNRIIRNLFGNKIEHNHTSDIYAYLKLLNIENSYKLELGKFMFNILYLNKYPIMKRVLDGLSWSHNYNTRKINTYMLPKCRVNVNKLSALNASVEL